MIRPEYKSFYGRAWRRYRERMIEIHGTRCTRCRRACLRYLNFAHETHDPVTSSIVRLCPTCHARADARHRSAVVRRRRAEASGQMWLLPELEYAVTPAWAIPDAALAAWQWELFA